MSEHDEPKTALTRLLTGALNVGGPLRHIFPDQTELLDALDVLLAQEIEQAADVLLAEGYTTTPAPEVQRLRDTLADVRAQRTETRRRLLELEAAAPEAVETVEWGVRYENRRWVAKFRDPAAARQEADYPIHPTGLNPVFVKRTRTSYADTVTEWVPVDRGADGHEEGER